MINEAKLRKAVKKIISEIISERIHSDLDYAEFMSILDELKYDLIQSKEKELATLVLTLEKYYNKNKQDTITQKDVLALFNKPPFNKIVDKIDMDKKPVIELLFSM